MTSGISRFGRTLGPFVVTAFVVACGAVATASPAGATITGSASPAAGLDYTGTLAVTASGFSAGSHSVFAIECEHGATDSSQCDGDTVDFLTADSSGNVADPSYTYFALPSAQLGASSQIVCDINHPCDLVVIANDYNDFRNPHVNLPITFSVETTNGVGTIPTGSINCGSGRCPGPPGSLGYSGSFEVSAAAFKPLDPIYAIECSQGATSIADCDTNTLNGPHNADAFGDYLINYSYYSLPNATFGGTDHLRCDATHACDVVLIQDAYTDFNNRHVNIPLTFDSGVDTPETPWLPLLPLGALSLGGAYVIGRRRSARTQLQA